VSGYTTIEIYCDNAIHGDRWKVRTFARTGIAEWMPLDLLVPDAGVGLWLGPDADVPLDETTNADLRQQLTGPFKRRDRRKFWCRKCYRRDRYRTERPVVVRDEQLGTILDAVAARDTPEVSLDNLAKLAKVVRSVGP
jgi:hypothetical protein